MEHAIPGGCQPVEVLLIEDNPGDARLTREAIVEGRATINFHHVSTGDEAMAFLRQEGAHHRAARPDIIILDLNLPGKDGRTVLHEIKQDAELRNIPVVVLTSSSDEQDIARSYALHANAYITKPLDLDRFTAAVRAIGEFWITVVRLPKEE